MHFKSGNPNMNEDAIYKLADFGTAFTGATLISKLKHMAEQKTIGLR